MESHASVERKDHAMLTNHTPCAVSSAWISWPTVSTTSVWISCSSTFTLPKPAVIKQAVNRPVYNLINRDGLAQANHSSTVKNMIRSQSHAHSCSNTWADLKHFYFYFYSFGLIATKIHQALLIAKTKLKQILHGLSLPFQPLPYNGLTTFA